jgi:seryl-tRNA synthetase
MIDPQLLRKIPREIAKALARRGYTLNVELISALEAERKVLQVLRKYKVSARNILGE